LARRVREARRAAGLTQVQLAKRLERSQTVVSHAENGVSRIGDRYVRAVLVACGLLVEASESEETFGDERKLGYFVGMDPETLELVRRGTARDEELRSKYAWWSNGYRAEQPGGNRPGSVTTP